MDYIHNYTDAHVTGDEEDDQLFLDWTQAGPDDDQADEELLHLYDDCPGQAKGPQLGKLLLQVAGYDVAEQGHAVHHLCVAGVYVMD